MTDGIIQEVFNKYLDIGTNSRILDIYLPLMQRELIERIKQELPCLDEGISKTLIGDNQK